MIRIFTYGTLRRKGRLEALAGTRAAGPQRARLQGYQKVNTPFGYPVILPAGGQHVDGFVWEFDDLDFGYLDGYEGVAEDPPYYFRRLETVEVDGQAVEAHVYVGNPERFGNGTSVSPTGPGANSSAATDRQEGESSLQMYHADTIAAHSGVPRGITEIDQPRPLIAPISQTSVFTFGSLEQLDAVWTGEQPGYVYSRMANPNIDELQDAIAAFENGEAGAVAGAGTSVILAALLACTSPGEHIIATREAYGGTYTLLTEDLPDRFRTPVTLVDVENLDEVRAALRETTRVLYIESVTNPLIRVAPLKELAAFACENGLLLVVDNTFPTPYLLRPLEWGADLTVHSATKFLNGHGDVTLGVAAGRTELIVRVRELIKRYGLNADPFGAWLLRRGMRTLAVRMQRAVENADRLARLLVMHPAVQSVNYPGLPGSSYHRRVQELMPRGGGGMLSFSLAGGLRAASQFVRELKLVQFAPSLGDVMTTISHPALTSHRGLGPEGRARVGIDDGLIRVSVGIEAIHDLLEDFQQALDATMEAPLE